jgi:hypothetical protein
MGQKSHLEPQEDEQVDTLLATEAGSPWVSLSFGPPPVWKDEGHDKGNHNRKTDDVLLAFLKGL